MNTYSKEQIATYFIDVLGLSAEELSKYTYARMIQYLKETEQLEEMKEYVGS